MSTSLFDNFVCHKIERKAPRRRDTKIDLLDWMPSGKDRQYAKEYGLDPDRIIQDIHCWAANVPPRKRTKPRPDLFWQTWVRREADRPRFNGKRDKLRFDHL